jgi:hypothetical protein
MAQEDGTGRWHWKMAQEDGTGRWHWKMALGDGRYPYCDFSFVLTEHANKIPTDSAEREGNEQLTSLP